MRRLLLLILLSLCAGCEKLSARIEGDPVRILAVGNSFSNDAVEYLDELAASAGIPVVIGNLYIGGCSLQRHAENAASDAHDYAYRKNKAGRFTSTPGYALSQALADEEWDFITVQQVSQNAGVPASYYPYIRTLLDYLTARAANPAMQLAFHQTWAYARDAEHEGFARYGRDQMEMYRRVVETTREVAAREQIPLMLPCGTAIQNLRGVVGDVLCVDGYHLAPLGRYAAACVWFEVLFGREVPDDAYVPKGISDHEARAARRAAHAAVENPYEVTPIE